MDELTIRAASPESARAILNVLSGFPAELVEIGLGSTVVVKLDDDTEIVSVLSALQKYVTNRGAGAAQVEFNGNSYAMHPEPDLGG